MVMEFTEGLWILLVVEPDYLPDSKVFVFSCVYTPMKNLHPKRMYTLPCGGVQRVVTPFEGSRGKWAPSGGLRAASPDGGSGAKSPKEKLPCKCIF
jgi:hypothetical protein